MLLTTLAMSMLVWSLIAPIAFQIVLDTKFIVDLTLTPFPFHQIV